MRDWMDGGVAENDAEEARSERIRSERAGEPHPYGCLCSRACQLDTAGMTEAEGRHRD